MSEQHSDYLAVPIQGPSRAITQSEAELAHFRCLDITISPGFGSTAIESGGIIEGRTGWLDLTTATAEGEGAQSREVKLNNCAR